MHSAVEGTDEPATLGIQEFVVFHSSKKAMLEHNVVSHSALTAVPAKQL
jgi:hypothetical protein